MMHSTGRRSRAPVARIVLSFALLAVVFNRIDWTRAWDILSGARLELILLTILIGWLGRGFAALRWYILVRGMSRQVSYASLLRLTFIGMFFQFLPAGSIAVEASRIYGMSRATSDLAASFASVFVERIFGLGALIIVALVGLAIAPPGVPPVLGQFAWMGFVFVVIVSMAAMSAVIRGILERLLSAMRLGAANQRLARVFECLDELKSRPDMLLLSVVVALLNTTFRILPAFLLALALGIDVSLAQLFVIVPIIVLAAQIPISAGGLGVREVGFVALLSLIGVPASEAVVLSLLLVATIFVVSLPGAWFYARGGLSPKSG